MATNTKLKKLGQKTQGIFNVIPKEFRVSLAVLGGGYLAYKLYRKLNPSEKEIAEEKLVEESEFTSEGESCMGKLSYRSSQYKAFATALHNAFVETVGTDEDAIYSVMNKMKNECDLLQVIAEFGVRRQEWGFEKLNLPQFINDEMSTKELQKVNSILRRKGITYRF